MNAFETHLTQLLNAGMLLGKDMVKFQIDCAASCNIISINLLNANNKLQHHNSIKAIGEMSNQNKKPKKSQTILFGVSSGKCRWYGAFAGHESQ